MNLSPVTARTFFLPRLQDILFISVFIAAMLIGPVMLNMDGDLPRHILTGKFIIETKTVPMTEPFAYPYQGQPYVSHEWLTDIIFYLIYKFTGLTGVTVLSALLLATTFYLLYRNRSSRFNLRVPTLFLVIWGAAVTSLNWVTRPHLISTLFLTVWLIWLDKLSREEKIKLWYFPLLMLLWSNLHGEFIAGILAMIAYLAGWVWDTLFNKEFAKKRLFENFRGRYPDMGVRARVRALSPPYPAPFTAKLGEPKKNTGVNLFLAAGFSFLASLVNPAGFGPWKTLLGFVNNSYLMSRMYEARPPDFSQPEFIVLLGLLSFSIFVLAINKQKITTSQAFLLTGFSAMSLIAGRNVHLYGIVAPFVLTGAVKQAKEVGILSRLENSISRIEKNLTGILWPVVTIAACILVVFATPAQNIYKFNSKMFPIQATNWILAHPQSGNLFNDLNWGGYLALYLWPEHLVFIDSMADTRGELTSEYENVITLSEKWREVLTKYQVDWLVIQSSSRLANALEREGWAILYKDKTATILRNTHKP